MNEQDIRELVAAYGFTDKVGDDVFRLCQDVERQTRHAYFGLIQSANNAATARSVTRREMDNWVYQVENAKREKKA